MATSYHFYTERFYVGIFLRPSCWFWKPDLHVSSRYITIDWLCFASEWKR